MASLASVGLRAADASIVLIINGNSNVPMMVIGKECADTILQELVQDKAGAGPPQKSHTSCAA